MKLKTYKGFLVEKPKKMQGFDRIYFKFEQIETYINLKEYLIEDSEIKSDKILLILSGVNVGYKIYKQEEEYIKTLNSVIKLLSSFTFFIQDDKKKYLHYYVILNKLDFLNNEYLLYEICLLFRFSSFLGLKTSIAEKEITCIIKNFSFYNVFNIKRWKSVANWQLFFDGEHLTGNLDSISKFG